MKVLSLTLLAACLVVLPSNASWGGGDCGPVGPMVVPSPVIEQPAYSWQSLQGVRQIALMQGQVQIGLYDLAKREYYSLRSDGTWSQACPAPAQLPPNLCKCTHNCNCDPLNCNCSGKEHLPPGLPPGGVQIEKIEAGKHYIGSREVDKKGIMEAIQKASIPADQNKLRVTLIGPAEVTAPVAASIKSMPEATDFIVKEYPADHWAVKGSGFETDGNPLCVYVETPDGQVLHRQKDYEGGAEALAEALRDARADHDPSLDPDRRPKDPLVVIKKSLEKVPVEVWILGGVVLFLMYRKGK